MITFFTMWNPIKSMMSTNDVFEKFETEGVNLALPKLVYFFANGLILGAGLYKCWSLGLFPTMPSDWVAYLPLKQPTEFSAILF